MYKSYISKKDINSNKKLVLVIYDIIDDKRRNNFVKLLESYGERVQKSAFELIIDKKQYKNLINKIPSLISNEDNIRVYEINLYDKIKYWGSSVTKENKTIII